MTKPHMTREDAQILQNIIDDAVFRMDAIAERGGYSVAQVRGAAVGGLALRALQAGQCKGKLLSGMEAILRCNCEIETKGSC